MRLQKYMSMCGVGSRRKNEEYILAGRVAINGHVITELGTKVDPDHDEVVFDGRKLHLEQTVTIALNKPVAVMCTNHDPEGRLTIQEFVKDIPVHLYHIGRLDYDTEGLLLMTNDGELANLMMHPRHEIRKVYHVYCEGVLQDKELKKLREGVLLDDGMTAPAGIRVIDCNDKKSELMVTIHEGRNRQVRRMFAAVGHTVIKLRRERIGTISLKGLRTGAWRVLSEQEVETLCQIAMGKGESWKK